MQLSKEEQEMVQAHRVGTQSQQSVEVDNRVNIKGNLYSSLDMALTASLNSGITEVRDKAREVYKSLKESGYTSVMDAGDNIPLGGIQALLTMAKAASTMEPTVDYDLVKESAILYDTVGATDELLEKDIKDHQDSLRNSDRPEAWDVSINPITGSKFQVNSATGEVREYIDPVDEVGAISEDSNVAYMEHIQGGGSAESFVILGDTDLVDK